MSMPLVWDHPLISKAVWKKSWCVCVCVCRGDGDRDKAGQLSKSEKEQNFNRDGMRETKKMKRRRVFYKMM